MHVCVQFTWFASPIQWQFHILFTFISMSCPAFSFYSLEQWKDFLLICMISPAWLLAFFNFFSAWFSIFHNSVHSLHRKPVISSNPSSAFFSLVWLPIHDIIWYNAQKYVKNNAPPTEGSDEFESFSVQNPQLSISPSLPSIWHSYTFLSPLARILK